MVIDGEILMRAVALGIGATLVMDIWNQFLARVFGIPSLSYCLLGRWVRHMAEGTFRHPSIAAVAPRSMECAVGWMTHYSIGIGLAATFVLAIAPHWPTHPTALPALLYGIATIVFPFFLMQPAFGLGIASARAPRPAQARLKSLATHTVFGIGLYLCGLGLSHLWPPRG